MATTHRQNFAHDLLCFAPDLLAEVVERLQIGLVEGVANDLNVHLVQVLLVDTALEKGGWKQELDMVLLSILVPCFAYPMVCPRGLRCKALLVLRPRE